MSDLPGFRRGESGLAGAPTIHWHALYGILKRGDALSPIPFNRIHGISLSNNTCENGNETARATQPSQGIEQASIHHTATIHTHWWDYNTSKKITPQTKTLNLAYECMQFHQRCQGASVVGSTSPGMILRVRFIGLQ